VFEVNEKSQPGKIQRLERFEPHFISLNETIMREKLLIILYYALDLLDSSAGLVALWSDKDRLFIEKVSYGLGPDESNYLRSLLQEAIPDLAENRTNS
jgi:hypothetical protein